jgi:hypothetical protein
MVKCGSISKLRCETSSLIPTVKLFFASGLPSSSKVALTIAGVKSFDPIPYRPPITRGMCGRSAAGDGLREAWS